MNIQYKESQIELFSQHAAGVQDAMHPRALAARLVLSTENLVILVIASIMVMIFCFSVGVERGKRLASSDGRSQVEVVEAVSEPAVRTQQTEAAEATPKQPSRNLWGGVMAMFKSKDVQPQEQANDEPVLQEIVLTDVDVASSQEVVSKAVAKVEKEITVPTGLFTLQLASYKTQKHANEEAKTLKQKGYEDIFILEKGKYIILCVGKFVKKDDAKAYTRRFKSRYGEPIIRRL